MNDEARARILFGRMSRVSVACVLAALAAIAAAPNQAWVASSSPTVASIVDLLRNDRRGGLDEADGALRDPVTVFDDQTPAVANLDPALRGALRTAATEAADDGVVLLVNSGWRSAKYQRQLLRGAVSKYGSVEEAARWVASAETSPHVSGDAVDVGHSEATEWLSKHGAKYGLCQIYNNERWHYELRPEAAGRGCPSRYSDASKDPRMQQ